MAIMTEDQLVFLGKVAEWLRSCPDGVVDYGEFYVSEVSIVFDGEPVGKFTSDDPSWLFVSHGEH